MIFIYTIIIGFIIIYSLLKEKNLYNPTVVFAGMWFVSGILSLLNLYNFNVVPDSIYFTVAIGVLCFALGAATRSKIRFRPTRILGINSGSYNELRYNLLIPFYLFVLGFTALLAIRSIVLLMHGVHMETIRFNYSSVEAGLVVRSAIQYDIEHYIVATAEFAGVALFPIVLMDSKSRKKHFLLIELILFFALHIFVTGARSFIFDLVFVIIVYLLIDAKLSRRFTEFFNRIPKSLVRLIGMGAIALFAIMTSLRRGSIDTIFHEIYAYFTMCFRLFDTHINIMLSNPDYTYGMTLLHGLLRIPLLLLKFIGIPYPSAYQKAIDAINANNVFYAVGKGSGNSFVTCFYYMFMDFGYVGIVIGCFVYGYFSKSIYYSMQKHPDKRSQAIYLLVAVGLFLSFTRLHFTAPRYVYAFFMLLFFFKESGEKDKIVGKV